MFLQKKKRKKKLCDEFSNFSLNLQFTFFLILGFPKKKLHTHTKEKKIQKEEKGNLVNLFPCPFSIPFHFFVLWFQDLFFKNESVEENLNFFLKKLLIFR